MAVVPSGRNRLLLVSPLSFVGWDSQLGYISTGGDVGIQERDSISPCFSHNGMQFSDGYKVQNGLGSTAARHAPEDHGADLKQDRTSVLKMGS